MRFRKLKDNHELNQFREEFLKSIQQRKDGPSVTKDQSAKDQNSNDKTTSDLPLAYLHANTVIGVFNPAGKMVAGYILGTEEPLRLLEFVPESARASLIVPFGLQWSDCCEITCAWRLPEISLLFMSSQFWPRAFIGVLQSGKKLLLGHNQNPRLDKFYTTTGPVTIYSGISTFGLASRLFAYSRSRMVISILGFWIYETPRRSLKKIMNRRAREHDL
jgi:hypothetical protein